MLLPGSTSNTKKRRRAKQKKKSIPRMASKEKGNKKKEVQSSSFQDLIEATTVGSDASLLLSVVSQASPTIIGIFEQH